MKIAFYIPNKNIANADLSTIQSGNPGIGGTEYAMLSLSYYLASYEDLSIHTYSNTVLKNYPADTSRHIAGDLQDALQQALTDNIDIIIVHHSEHSMRKDAFDILNSSKVSVVVWIHNFISSKHLSFYSEAIPVKRIVFVGREFYYLYRDHPAVYKSTYIYNGISIPDSMDLIPFNQRKNEVTYIGNLIKGKGFHVLAKAWKQVVRECPTAHLNVIGSGKLYNRSSKMGKYGIAEEKYERLFMKYLCDDSGNIMSSVTFHGILGAEKDEIIGNTKVGVPNPTGQSETFGYTAIEMALGGSLITTIKCPGYLDTVSSSGILYESPKELAKSILKLLQREDNDYSATLEFIRSNFAYQTISRKWHALFIDIAENKPVRLTDEPISYRLGKLREKMRKLKMTYPMFAFLPTITSFEQFITNISSPSYYKKTLRKVLTAVHARKIV